MHKYIPFFMALLSVTLLQAQTNPLKDEALIRAARAASNNAIAKHDIDGIAKSLLPDFVITKGNASSFKGRDSAITSWKTLFASNSKVVYVRTPLQVTVSKNDTLAWETGTWRAEHSYSGGGNYSAMWRKKAGIWMIQAELFVSMEK